jgi:hypothetical protein
VPRAFLTHSVTAGWVSSVLASDFEVKYTQSNEIWSRTWNTLTIHWVKGISDSWGKANTVTIFFLARLGALFSLQTLYLPRRNILYTFGHQKREKQILSPTFWQSPVPGAGSLSQGLQGQGGECPAVAQITTLHNVVKLPSSASDCARTPSSLLSKCFTHSRVCLDCKIVVTVVSACDCWENCKRECT